MDIEFHHALAGLNGREVIASVGVRQDIAATVQRYHRATDAQLAAVLPAIAVQVVKDLADDGAEIEYRIGDDLQVDADRLRYRAGIADIDCDREVGISANPGTRADDHAVRQYVITGFTRIGYAVAVGIDQRLHVADSEYHRWSRQWIGDSDSVQASRTRYVSKYWRRLVKHAHVADSGANHVADSDRVGHDIANRCLLRMDCLF